MISCSRAMEWCSLLPSVINTLQPAINYLNQSQLSTLSFPVYSNGSLKSCIFLLSSTSLSSALWSFPVYSNGTLTSCCIFFLASLEMFQDYIFNKGSLKTLQILENLILEHVPVGVQAGWTAVPSLPCAASPISQALLFPTNERKAELLCIWEVLKCLAEGRISEWGCWTLHIYSLLEQKELRGFVMMHLIRNKGVTITSISDFSVLPHWCSIRSAQLNSPDLGHCPLCCFVLFPGVWPNITFSV